MSEPAKVFEDRETPGQWRVEWIGDDGRGELQILLARWMRQRQKNPPPVRVGKLRRE